jgi:hypothetical protein
MPRYVRLSDQTICGIDAVRAACPQCSVPDGLDHSALGFALLQETLPPAPAPWCAVVEGIPSGGVQTWVQQPMAQVEIIAGCVAAVEARLDAFAAERHYVSIVSACSYASSSNPRFAADARRALDVRDAVWAECYAILNEAQAGKRPVPALDELFAALPAMTWE